jgi:hypothetical protein
LIDVVPVASLRSFSARALPYLLGSLLACGFGACLNPQPDDPSVSGSPPFEPTTAADNPDNPYGEAAAPGGAAAGTGTQSDNGTASTAPPANTPAKDGRGADAGVQPDGGVADLPDGGVQ